MSDITTLMMAASGGVAGAYEISRSLRFNSADSAYLNRTPASAGNRKTWTWSGWVKRSVLATAGHTLFGSGTSGTDYCFLYFQNDDKLVFYNYSSAGIFPIRSTPLYRDVSAWYHVVLAVDTTQATSSNRVKIWVNNQQITAFSEATYPDQNDDLVVNSTSAHAVGAFLTTSPSGYFNGYMTEVHFIDGQALTPSSFGEINEDTGVWSPIRYAGTYGTNGFYLNFSDNSGVTSSTLGKDSSGNNNDWTPNNFSVTAGAGNDSLVDVPTRNAENVDTGAGGEVRGNYCTLNPLVQRWDVYTATISNGNLDAADTVVDANNPFVFGTTLVSSGKFYWEITVTAIGNLDSSFFIGIDSGKSQNGATFSDTVGYSGNGQKFVGGSSSAYGATYTTGDVIGVALDKDAGTVTFYKNNASQGAISLPTNVPIVAWISPGRGGPSSATANFGQRPFAYTAPSGFKALVTTNLPVGTITTSGTFTGNGSTDGPFVYLNGVPTAMTIDGNAVTFGTHADKLANGFKVRSSSASYNANATSMSYSITSTGANFKNAVAQPNP
jgi:hypothetical protein